MYSATVFNRVWSRIATYVLTMVFVCKVVCLLIYLLVFGLIDISCKKLTLGNFDLDLKILFWYDTLQEVLKDTFLQEFSTKWLCPILKDTFSGLKIPYRTWFKTILMIPHRKCLKIPCRLSGTWQQMLMSFNDTLKRNLNIIKEY